jgi:hypothetical protein
METQLKRNTRIRANGFDISIGKRIDQIAIISRSTDEFTPFNAIKKGGRLAKIKRKFKGNLCSSTHFFFEGMGENDVLQLIKILK